MKKSVLVGFSCLLLTGIIPSSVFAYSSADVLNVNNPHIIDDTQDYSNKGELTYTYEGDYYIQSYALTPEEIKLGKQLQE